MMLCELLVYSYAESTVIIKGRFGQVCVWWQCIVCDTLTNVRTGYIKGGHTG